MSSNIKGILQQWSQLENEDWDGHPQSYDMVIFLSGKKLTDPYGMIL
jgi:hypothetical protein